MLRSFGARRKPNLTTVSELGPKDSILWEVHRRGDLEEGGTKAKYVHLLREPLLEQLGCHIDRIALHVAINYVGHSVYMDRLAEVA